MIIYNAFNIDTFSSSIDYIDTQSQQIDLRKFRSYRGDSVKDLLRALRNKVTYEYLFRTVY